MEKIFQLKTIKRTTCVPFLFESYFILLLLFFINYVFLGIVLCIRKRHIFQRQRDIKVENAPKTVLIFFVFICFIAYYLPVCVISCQYMLSVFATRKVKATGAFVRSPDKQDNKLRLKSSTYHLSHDTVLFQVYFISTHKYSFIKDVLALLRTLPY